MKKYILHGGYTNTLNSLNKGFFNEIVNDLSDGGRVLIVYFAREEKGWTTLFTQDEKRFKRAIQGRDIKLTIARKDGFINQVTSSDAIYMRGGTSRRLMDALKEFPEFSEAIKDKIVAGSSAGAYALSTFYYTYESKQVLRGLGILPINVICHFDGNQKVVELINKSKRVIKGVIKGHKRGQVPFFIKGVRYLFLRRYATISLIRQVLSHM